METREDNAMQEEAEGTRKLDTSIEVESTDEFPTPVQDDLGDTVPGVAPTEELTYVPAPPPAPVPAPQSQYAPAPQGPPVAEMPHEEAASKRRGGPSRVLILFLVLVTAAVLGFLAYFIIHPYVPDQQIVSSAVSLPWSSEGISDSEWASNVGYEVVNVEVLERVAIDAAQTPAGTPGTEAKTAVTLQNESFEALASVTMRFCKDASGNWYCYEHEVTDITLTPLGGISDGMIVSAFPNLLYSAQGDAADGITSVYSDADFSVERNDVGPDGGAATIAMSTRHGLRAYQGTCVVNFEWEDGDWHIDSVRVSDDALDPDYSAAVGTWEGTLTSTPTPTSYWIFSTGHKCWAGSSHPATLEITSVDSSTMMATANVTFVVHNHGEIPNDADWSVGDEQISVEGVVFYLEEQGFYESYSAQHTGALGTTTYRLFFTCDSDTGNLSLRVVCDNSTSFTTWTDEYDMSYEG